MFPYDTALLSSLQTQPESIPDVLATMQTIESLAADSDGLKWFNWLYLQVTNAVEERENAGGFTDLAFLAELDVQFARLYFNALEASLSGQPVPDCWQTLFSRRNQTELGRIQFAMAGINAHINHDLPMAIVAACQNRNLVPRHSTDQYADFTALNSTLDSLIEESKQALHVRLLGDVLPAASSLENALAAWSVSAAREAAWNNAELLWHLQPEPGLSAAFLHTLDGLTGLVGQGLLVPIP